jgi:hypothetical protein
MADNFQIQLPVTAFIPASSNGPAQICLATYDRPALAFDDTTVETAQSFPVQVPASYTGSGTLKLDIWYVMATAITGSVAFRAYVEAVASAETIDLDAGDSYDSANQGNSSVPGTAGYPTKLTITLTNKDSLAAGESIRIKLDRYATDGTNDTATGDARVLGCVLREEA